MLACCRPQEPVQKVLGEIELQGTSAVRWSLIRAWRGRLGEACTKVRLAARVELQSTRAASRCRSASVPL